MPNLVSQHIDHVLSVGMLGGPAAGAETLFQKSWSRCMKQHGLDPARPSPARILPSTQLREHQQRMEGFLRVARAGMEEMYRRVADLGYMLLLTDADGVTVDYIGNPATEPLLKAAGLYLGADWNEAHAGTCGVGTCLIEQTPITCHQTEHFDATHIALTCTSAPLFAPDGQLLGALDVSALRSPEARESQHLILQMTKMYAQTIEDANFVRHFARHWILRLGKSAGLVDVSSEVMLALEEDGTIIGANTGARRRLGHGGALRATDSQLVGLNLSEVLDTPVDAVWALARSGAGELRSVWSHQQEHFYPALVPPRGRTAGGPEAIVLPQRPRRPARAGDTRPIDGPLDGLAGSDPAMQRLIGQAKRLVDRNVNLLIQGETGSGKEVLARALHGHSQRAAKPFVAVNCASIPESLIESELFGYTPGTFTGGRSKGMKGLIAQSDEGTLFLDEIGDMPLHLQTRLLRVLAESEVLPLGADQPIPVKLNVIAASHRDLRRSVEQGHFREDLFFRLAGTTLRLPPLREREDKLFLIETLFDEEARAQGLEAAELSPEAVAALLRHRWPGNVRELRNALRFAVALSGDAPVTLDDLPGEVREADRTAPPPIALAGATAASEQPAEAAGLSDGGQLLLQALRRHKWCVTSAAQELGICRATVYRQMKRHGITPPNLL
ncbi:sigma-54-dependent Fis family transcriptional regulator [Aquariibacter albus]|uniref:Sigma-54-dependent Fis family transcriptional regulator n=1 Tax=Aquariibacter albus TaxID=2759899 RepID=A0A839HSA0_9BURK|nr:sigma-54-dependent Fis family transcriptional regulator [Aquariibacter albus]MBB1162011.1 sigma-54-dependent Fis family transcriptional regulator [Aquariibacter albus]